MERLGEVAKEGERRVGLVRRQLREAEEAVGEAVMQERRRVTKYWRGKVSLYLSKETWAMERLRRQFVRHVTSSVVPIHQSLTASLPA